MIIQVSCTTRTSLGTDEKQIITTSVLKMSADSLTSFILYLMYSSPANSVYHQLLDRNTRLHFSLLRLQLTELIKKCTASPDGDITPALNFAQSHLAPLAPTDPAFLSDLERTMALLIFPPDNLAAPLTGLLDPEQRLIVAEEVNEAILEELEFAGAPKLKGLIKFRAWAERRAREKKLPLPEEGIDLFDRKTATEPARDGEDSVMNG